MIDRFYLKLRIKEKIFYKYATRLSNIKKVLIKKKKSNLIK